MPKYIENFLNVGERPFNTAFFRLWNELAWEQRSDAPRREYWTNSLNRSYSYGFGAGFRTYHPQETHEVIEKVSDLLEAKLGFRYEGCFLNGYTSERNSLGWHADDDAGIDHDFPIAVVSFYDVGDESGLRHIQTKPLKAQNLPEVEINTFLLGDGSLFLMDAGMQHTHFHRIPKCGFKARSRISLTFRKLKSQVIQ